MSLKEVWRYEDSDRSILAAYPGYSGTTLENFLKCAYVNGKGQIVFYKKRESLHPNKGIFCVTRLSEAYSYAIERAQELTHHPLIIAGMILPEYVAEYDDGLRILKHTLRWPIEEVYLLSEGVNLDTAHLMPPEKLFIQYNPRQILKDFSIKVAI